MAKYSSHFLLILLLLRSVAVEVRDGVLVMIDDHVSLGAKLLRLHVILLGEALFQQSEAPRDLLEVRARGTRGVGCSSVGHTIFCSKPPHARARSRSPCKSKKIL